MKKTILFLLLISALQALAQGPFAPVGAQWTYDYLSLGNNRQLGLPIFMRSRENTVKGGRACRKLGVTEIDFAYPLYVYSQNDSVFICDERSSRNWRLLYDYSARPGDTWEIPHVTKNFGISSGETMLIRVDSVGTVQFCNQLLRAWYISYDTTRFRWGNRIVEWVGNTFSFIPYLASSTIIVPAPLRCYRDSIRICKAVSYRCDTIWTSASEAEVTDWSITPNPTDDLLNVEVADLPAGEAKLELYSLISGHLAQRVVLPESGRAQISLSILPAGTYMAVLRNERRIMGRKKVVIIR